MELIYTPSTVVTTQESAATITSRAVPPVEVLTGGKEQRVRSRPSYLYRWAAFMATHWRAVLVVWVGLPPPARDDGAFLLLAFRLDLPVAVERPAGLVHLARVEVLAVVAEAAVAGQLVASSVSNWI